MRYVRRRHAGDAADLLRELCVGCADSNWRVHRCNRELHSGADFDGDAGVWRVQQGIAEPHAYLHGCV